MQYFIVFANYIRALFSLALISSVIRTQIYDVAKFLVLKLFSVTTYEFTVQDFLHFSKDIWNKISTDICVV